MEALWHFHTRSSFSFLIFLALIFRPSLRPLFFLNLLWTFAVNLMLFSLEPRLDYLLSFPLRFIDTFVCSAILGLVFSLSILSGVKFALCSTCAIPRGVD